MSQISVVLELPEIGESFKLVGSIVFRDEQGCVDTISQQTLVEVVEAYGETIKLRPIDGRHVGEVISAHILDFFGALGAGLLRGHCRSVAEVSNVTLAAVIGTVNMS